MAACLGIVEMDNAHMEGEGAPVNAYALLQLKRPDAWRPVDGKLALSLQDTDTYKTARYTPLRNRLSRLLPGW
jgi:hypothetical protein